jgi:hypothetical protein
LGTNTVIIVTLIATAAISLGASVQLDFTQTDTDRFDHVKTAVAGQPSACGVALEAATVAGERIRVQVYGPLAAGIATATAATAGNVNLAVNTTDGTLTTKVAADVMPTLAMSLAAEAGGEIECFLLDPMGLRLR